jgi:eukaryotic-like serine/threonine-protein kinase
MIGQTLAQYRIREKIGAGGMGVVYLARDEKLQRDVAIKVLPAGTLSDEVARRRFREEALSLARLNHPNIATVHDFGTQDGIDFLVTEYIPGVNLDAKIAGRPLPGKTLLALGVQLAQGMLAAHEQGLVHRDLKPANLRITPDGRLKILDFGLARLIRTEADSDLTASVTKLEDTMGTLPYMAPEQLRGEKTDARSDIWSVGAVLYEMATGRRPFPESHGPLLIDAILNRDPDPPKKWNREVSPGLENVILKALDKDPQHRYQSVRELLIDLERLTTGVSPLATSSRGFWKQGTARWWASGGIATLVIVGLLFSATSMRNNLGAKRSESDERHIAVLPFDNIGKNPATEEVAEGLMDSLTSKFSNLETGEKSLWVVPSSVVRRRQVEDPTAALRDLGATMVVKGSIQKEGQGVLLTVNLINAKTLRQVGSVELRDAAGDISSLQNEVVTRIAKMMGVEVTPDMLRTSGSSAVPAAYESYLKALGLIQRYDKPGNLDAAIDALQSAVNHDVRFAVGYAALGEAYRLKYQVDRNPKWLQEATANCKRASDLDNRLPSVFVTLGRIHDDAGKHDLAIQEFQHALELNPRDADALNGMAHAYENAGRVADAEAAFKKAAALRPDYWDGYNTLGLFYDRQRKYGDSIAALQRAIELTPDNAQAYFNLGAVYLDTSDPKKIPDAERALKKSLELGPTFAAYANLGFLYTQLGNYKESAAMTEKALELNDKDYLIWANLANAYAWTKETEKLDTVRSRELALLEQAAKTKPNDAQVQASLAAVYAQKKMKDQALARAQTALALAPDDPTVLVTVGSTYEILGTRKEAIQFIQKGMAKGYTLDDLQRDPDLQTLLSDPSFKPIAKK